MNDSQLSVLIVSPDRPLVRQISRFLEVFGFAVQQAADAGLALAAAQSASPHYVLLDGSARQPQNLAVLRRIRQLAPERYVFGLYLAQQPDAAELTEALEAGCDDFLARPVVFGELLARLRTGARVIEFERRLAAQTGLDSATGWPDRASLLARLSQRQQSPAAGGWLALFDLDFFSRILRQAGLAASQKLLREAAGLLRGEPAEGIWGAAWGEDRLAVLGTGGLEAGNRWATAALARLAEREFSLHDTTVRLTASCGLTELAAGDSVEAVIGRAERALALAKSSGRNCLASANEVESDTQQWTALASDGKLFATTLARDVMAPCPLLLHVDETVEQAHALMELTKLTAIPVVDGEGRLAGLATAAQLEAVRGHSSRPRGGSSVRLLRHVLTTDVKRFDETTPLAELLEFFTGDAAPLAVVVRDRRPTGLVHCQGLAALNERLSAGKFAPLTPAKHGSEDLLVPDLALAE